MRQRLCLVCRAVAISAATQGILDRRTALALKPALDQIGSVLEEVVPPWSPCVPCMRSYSLAHMFSRSLDPHIADCSIVTGETTPQIS